MFPPDLVYPFPLNWRGNTVKGSVKGLMGVGFSLQFFTCSRHLKILIRVTIATNPNLWQISSHYSVAAPTIMSSKTGNLRIHAEYTSNIFSIFIFRSLFRTGLIPSCQFQVMKLTKPFLPLNLSKILNLSISYFSFPLLLASRPTSSPFPCTSSQLRRRNSDAKKVSLTHESLPGSLDVPSVLQLNRIWIVLASWRG